MKTALRIFVRDLKRILRNPVAIVIALGVAAIPSLYAWINILANWDPYNNTSTVPIAVTIEDTGANVEGVGFTNAGDMIHDELEKNDQLDWIFVDDEDEAKEGVSNGRYYAAFVIPGDFTSSLADVLQGNTDKAHIAYYANEKVNAIAPKVTDTGATTLEDQITQRFVGVVGKAIAEKLQAAVGNAAAKADEANASLLDGLRQEQASLQALASELSGAGSTIQSSRDAIAQARSTLSDLAGTTSSLQGSLDDALSNLSDTRKKSQSLAADLSRALGTSVSTLSGISSGANYDIGQITGDIGWAQGRIDAAISEIRAVNGTVQSLKTTLETARKTTASVKLPDGSSLETQKQLTAELDQEISVLVTLSDNQLAALDELQKISDDVKGGADSVSNLSSSVNDAVQQGTKALADLQSTLASNTIPGLSSSLDSFSDAGGRLAGTVGALSPMLQQADGTLAELDAILQQGQATIDQTTSALSDAAGRVGSLADDVAGLQSLDSFSFVRGVLGLDPEQTGDFVGSPVEMVSNAIYPVANYGTGMTPFYTNLALWVGGFVLVAIYKLEVDTEGVGPFKPWQGFLGRWLLMILIGQLQALICCIGDLVIGVQAVSPTAFLFAGMVCSFVYVSFVYSISIAFKHVGKALAVLIVVLQIPGASGAYPIQLQPGFFQAIHPWLPFTYGINAMREAIAGFYGSYYAQNLLVLALFLIPAVLMGITARRHLLNINALFDRRLAETDMMVTERVGMKGSYFRLSTIVKVLMDSGSYREVFLKRAAQFELAYPTLVRRGFWALAVIPLLLTILLFVLPAKFLLLILWICSCVGICTYLIVVEYLHSRVGQKTALASMSRAELYDLLDDELRSELMAFAPIQKMQLEREARRDGISVTIDDDGAGDDSAANGSTTSDDGTDAAATTGETVTLAPRDEDGKDGDAR